MTGEKKLSHEPMLELYIYETSTLVEQLEEVIIGMEAKRNMGTSELERILNALHAIKSASAMMLFPHTARAAHAVEELFSRFKEEIPVAVDYESICDLVLETLDFIKREIRRAAEGLEPEGPCKGLVDRVAELTAHYGADGTDKKPEAPVGQKYYITHAAYKEHTNRCYHAKITFEKNCQMENIRAFTVVHNLRECCRELYHRPNDLIRDLTSSEWITRHGFHLYFSSEHAEAELRMAIEDAILIEDYSLERIDSLGAYTYDLVPSEQGSKARGEPSFSSLPESHEAEESVGYSQQNTSGQEKEALLSGTKLDSLAELVNQISMTESALSQSACESKSWTAETENALCRLKTQVRNLEELLQAIRKSGTL